MFRTVPLSVISSFSLDTQQWCMSYRFADIYNCYVSSEKLLMMGRGTVRNTQSLIQKINLRNQCIQFVLLKEFIMMHGHLNVKNCQIHFKFYVCDKTACFFNMTLLWLVTLGCCLQCFTRPTDQNNPLVCRHLCSAFRRLYRTKLSTVMADKQPVVCVCVCVCGGGFC